MNPLDCAPPPQMIGVADVAVSPEYRVTASGAQEFDLALITLARPARLTEWVSPVCLPRPALPSSTRQHPLILPQIRVSQQHSSPMTMLNCDADTDPGRVGDDWEEQADKPLPPADGAQAGQWGGLLPVLERAADPPVSGILVIIICNKAFLVQ